MLTRRGLTAARRPAAFRAMSSDVGAMYERAKEAQPAWAAAPLAERQAVLTAFAKLLQENAGELAEVLTSEMGKPLKYAKGEIAATAPRVKYFVDRVEGVVADDVVRSNARKEERLRWEPLGVVGSVSAWNYPYFVGSNVYVPALLCGNAVLYKPSEHVAESGRRMEALLREAGLPEGLFQCVSGGPEAGEALLAAPIDGMFFTGSARTGMHIKRSLVERNIPIQLELGGCDAAYVMPDLLGADGDLARVRNAAEGLADGAMFNSGQGCCSIERIYVHEDVYEPFVAELVEAVRGVKVGDPREAGVTNGPLCLASAPDAIAAQVDEAVAGGAELLCGGAKRAGGNFFEPTVLAGATQGMRIMREESFGPVVAVARVASDAEAAARMNDSDFGLTASVYGLDRARADAVLRAVKTGTAYFNCCDRVSPYLPWTGQKLSGVGGTCGEVGIRAFVRPKAYHYVDATA